MYKQCVEKHLDFMKETYLRISSTSDLMASKWRSELKRGSRGWWGMARDQDLSLAQEVLNIMQIYYQHLVSEDRGEKYLTFHHSEHHTYSYSFH